MLWIFWRILVSFSPQRGTFLRIVLALNLSDETLAVIAQTWDFGRLRGFLLRPRITDRQSRQAQLQAHIRPVAAKQC
jgi:hypothetical protein